MNQLKVVIFTARGRDSLSEAHSAAIEKIALVEYVSNLTVMDDQKIINICQSADYIGLTRRTCVNFNSHIIRSLPKLKGLSVYSTGIEWVDLKALAQQKIEFRHLVDYSAQTVSEHAMAMLLNCSRRIHLSDRIVNAELPRSISIRGWELHSKNIGILGMGQIGSRIANLCHAFGMNVSFYDPKFTNINGFEYLSFQELITQSDIIMVAASVDRDKPVIITSDIIINNIKKGAYIINPSRPALVDNQAVLDAIRNKHINGYAVDEFVYTQEELKNVENGRILQSAHSGWYSDEAMARGTGKWIENLVELMAHE